MSQGGKYDHVRTIYGTECVETDCRLQRQAGSIKCPKHSRAHRNPDQGPNRPSDGVHTGSKPKLTDEDVAEIRRMWSQFKPVKEIAAHFKVSTVTVRKYLKQSRSAS